MIRKRRCGELACLLQCNTTAQWARQPTPGDAGMPVWCCLPHAPFFQTSDAAEIPEEAVGTRRHSVLRSPIPALRSLGQTGTGPARFGKTSGRCRSVCMSHDSSLGLPRTPQLCPYLLLCRFRPSTENLLLDAMAE